MILLLFFVAGLLIGALRGGGPGGLVTMKIRWIWLIILSFLAERCFVFVPASVFRTYAFLLPALQLVRFLSLLLFAALNVKDWRICLAGAGIALNFAVIALNGWRMPIGPQVFAMPDMADYVAKVQAGGMPEYMLMGGSAGANLWFLADIISFKLFAFYPTIFMSAGDILLGVGVMLVVQHGMAGYARGKHARRGRKRRPAAAPETPAPIQETPPVAPAFAARSGPPAVSAEPPAAAPEPADAPEPPPAPPAEPRPDMPLLQTLPADAFALEGPEEPAGRADIPVRLSPRLETIARMAERGACVADVGCDHGKLAAWLALRGVPMVIASDVSAKSLAKARRLVDELGLRRSVQTRVSDGLRKLKSGEADVIVLAGMGGPTICGILAAGYDKALAADRLILQPMNAVGAVRRWLTDNGFRISDERLAEEEGRIYQILAAVPGDDPFPPMSLFDLEVGRLLVDCRHPLLGKLLDNKMQTIDTILSEIAENATPKAEARRNELLGLRQRCAEVREWLAG